MDEIAWLLLIEFNFETGVENVATGDSKLNDSPVLEHVNQQNHRPFS